MAHVLQRYLKAAFAAKNLGVKMRWNRSYASFVICFTAKEDTLYLPYSHKTSIGVKMKHESLESSYYYYSRFFRKSKIIYSKFLFDIDDTSVPRIIHLIYRTSHSLFSYDSKSRIYIITDQISVYIFQCFFIRIRDSIISVIFS